MSAQSPFAPRPPLSRYAIDRDHTAREREDVFDRLWADPSTRVLPMWNDLALLSGPDRLALLTGDRLSPEDRGEQVYLGRTTTATGDAPAGTPVVAVAVGDATAQRLGPDWGSLRVLGHRLSDRDAGLFAQALAMFNWHASHLYSPRSGQPATAAKGGWVRIDSADGSELFPRIDAAVIVAVTDQDDRLLLGSNVLWEHDRFSLLAGFVEPGESLEAAVEREVFEEAGLRVADPQYVASQPWPFPASLMVGFNARVPAGQAIEPVPDGTEIVQLRWFTRQELAGSLEKITLPHGSSIARAMIESWFGGPIEGAR